MKTLDTKEYLDTLCELAESGREVSTVVSGGSMLPFLSSGRDIVYLRKPETPPKKGDVALFIRNDGSYILHRIRFIRKDGYYMIGDRQIATEGPIKLSQIAAVAIKVRRKGKLLTPKSTTWKFYKHIWLRTVRLRPLIFRIRSLFKK